MCSLFTNQHFVFIYILHTGTVFSLLSPLTLPEQFFSCVNSVFFSLQLCDESDHWVCGSNGKSYRNHCELHRDACVSQTKIHVELRRRCVGQYMHVAAHCDSSGYDTSCDGGLCAYFGRESD